MMQKSTLKGYSLGIVGAAVATAGTFALFNTPVVYGADVNDTISTLQNLSDSYVKVAEETSHGVVYIEISKTMAAPVAYPGAPGANGSPFRHFFGPRGNGQPMPQMPQEDAMPAPVGSGSGFIISSDGYIVTNHHVAGEADGLRVTLEDGRRFDATLIGSDPQTEVALIKIDAEDLPTVRLGDSDGVRVGEWILAVGSPFGLDFTVTSGIVSAQGRSEVGIVDYANFIQTDAAINPGNSGGPLINLRGEVVGMNTAILSRSGGNNGIGFAIPINMVKYVVDDLKDDGKVDRGFLGVSIQNLTPELSNWFEIEGDQGALIAEVVEGSPAYEAGLEQDDIVVRFDGHVVHDASALRSRVATTKPGKATPVEVLRDGKKVEKSVKLGRLDSDEVVAERSTPQGNRRLGLQLQDLDDSIAEQLGYTGETGVVIADVLAGSPAAREGLRRGTIVTEVNRQPVSSVQEFKDAMEKGKKNDTVLLNITRDGHSRYVALQLK